MFMNSLRNLLKKSPILVKKVKPYFINKQLTVQIYYSDSRKCDCEIITISSDERAKLGGTLYSEVGFFLFLHNFFPIHRTIWKF